MMLQSLMVIAQWHTVEKHSSCKLHTKQFEMNLLNTLSTNDYSISRQLMDIIISINQKGYGL